MIIKLRNILAVVLVLITMSLTGCAAQYTGSIVKQLQPTELYYVYGVRSINLRAISRCALPPTVNIVNAEPRVEDYVVHDLPGAKGFVNPKKLMDGVVDYLKYGFEKSKVQIDSNSSKIIRLSLKGAKGYVGIPFTGGKGDFQIIVDIPEIKYTESFEAHDRTGVPDPIRAIAYAIHVVTRQIIDDQEIQDYILCR